jgi:hypothetical protein
MRVLECVVGVSLIVVSGMNAIRQLVMLARRYRSTSVWQLVSLPAAGIFRGVFTGLLIGEIDHVEFGTPAARMAAFTIA